MWRDLTSAVVALALASSVLGGQAAPTGAIAGSVVDVAGQPIAGAKVKIADPKTGFEALATATNGQFAFDNLAPARYTLTALADKYMPMEYGAFQPGDPGVPVVAIARQRVSNLVIALRRGGAISGQLFDDHGDAISGHVSILEPGARGMQTVTAGATDANGRYRLGDLPPGSFAVLAVPDLARDRRVKDAAGVEHVLMPMPTFFPNATTFPAASLVAVAGDDEASGTDVHIQAQPATSVEITLTTAGGRSLDHVQAVLLAEDERGPAGALWAENPDANAKVTIAGVVAGQYRLIVSGFERLPAPPVRSSAVESGVIQEWAVRNLFVDGVTAIAMPVLLEASATLECRAASEGEASGPVALRLRSIESDLPRALERAPDVVTFAGGPRTSIHGILPGRYILQVSDDDGSSMKAIKEARIDGVDVLDLPIELRAGETTAVTLTVMDRPSTLIGIVTGAGGQPRLDVAVVAFPRDSRYWLRGSRRLVAVRPDTSGAYEIKGLPGGEYFIAAVPERPPDDLSDAPWLSGVASAAARVTIVDGQRQVQDLRVR